MLRYVTVEKCKRRKVNETGGPDVMSDISDNVCQPKYKLSSCSDHESGSGEFPAGRRGKSESKPNPAGGATSVPVDRRQVYFPRPRRQSWVQINSLVFNNGFWAKIQYN